MKILSLLPFFLGFYEIKSVWKIIVFCGDILHFRHESAEMVNLSIYMDKKNRSLIESFNNNCGFEW